MMDEGTSPASFVADQGYWSFADTPFDKLYRSVVETTIGYKLVHGEEPLSGGMVNNCLQEGVNPILWPLTTGRTAAFEMGQIDRSIENARIFRPNALACYALPWVICPDGQPAFPSFTPPAPGETVMGKAKGGKVVQFFNLIDWHPLMKVTGNGDCDDCFVNEIMVNEGHYYTFISRDPDGAGDGMEFVFREGPGFKVTDYTYEYPPEDLIDQYRESTEKVRTMDKAEIDQVFDNLKNQRTSVTIRFRYNYKAIISHTWFLRSIDMFFKLRLITPSWFR